MAEVQSAMQADGGHNVPCVTHAFLTPSRSIYGAFSTLYAPALFFWADSRKSQAIASYRCLRLAIQEFRKLGHHRILLPIQPDSPFYRWVVPLGFIPMGPCELFEFNPPEESPCALASLPSPHPPPLL